MRYEKIDYIKWFLILVMVLFHFNYILANVFNINTWIGDFSLKIIQIIWASLFIWLSGLCFSISEKKHWENIWKIYLKKALFLSILALWISIVTYLFIYQQLIIFWIIHFFALSFFLLTFFRRFKYFNLIIGLFLIILWNVFLNIEASNNYFFWLWLYDEFFFSADYYPILPWFWISLLGYVLWLFLLEKDLLEKAFSGKIRYFRIFEFLWRYSLLIYMIHAPIIYFILKPFMK